MNYKLAMKECIRRSGWTYKGIARVIGRQSGVCITNMLAPVRYKKDGTMKRNGMTVETMLRILNAVGARVYIEWRDERNRHIKQKWIIDNSDYLGEEAVRHNTEQYLYDDDDDRLANMVYLKR